ncbi:MAG: calcium-binding protein [Geminicoccaceae bacterium]|nr:calcium-binding protein [Geminicoccaceae bacterium]
MARQTGGDRRGRLIGTDEDDVLVGEALNFEPNRVGRNNYITGGAGNDFLYGDAGNQDDPFTQGVIPAGARGGADRIYGGAGNDSIQGDAQTIDGGSGGADQLFGDDGNDEIFADAVDGRGGARGGNDRVSGGNGDDRLFGDFARDDGTTIGGNDQLTGGPGRDVFFLGKGRDLVRDFKQGEDFLNIEQVLFGDRRLTFADLDKNNDGKLTNADGSHIRVAGTKVTLDLGAAVGGPANVDVTVIQVTKGVVLGASDFVEFGGRFWDPLPST